MASTGMNRFLIMWETRTLENDPTWRGYDIIGALQTFKKHTLDNYIKSALKEIGLNYAGEHARSQFSVLYEVPFAETTFVLAAWWVWSRIARGRRIKGVKIRAANDRGEGSGATTLAQLRAPAVQTPSEAAFSGIRLGT